MKTTEQVLIETYGCKDLADLKRCFIDNTLSLSMIQDAMRAYREQDDEWVSVEDDLPLMMAIDLLQGGTFIWMLDKDNLVSIGMVADHNVWKYEAEEHGVIAWQYVNVPSPPKQEGGEG